MQTGADRLGQRLFCTYNGIPKGQCPIGGSLRAEPSNSILGKQLFQQLFPCHRSARNGIFGVIFQNELRIFHTDDLVAVDIACCFLQ